MVRRSEWVSEEGASRLLRLAPPVIAAYAGRGYIRSNGHDRPAAERRYLRADVLSLRDRAGADEESARWDLPSIESGTTRIASGRLFYRGHDVCELTAERSLDEVASLLWTGSFESEIGDTPLHAIAGGAAGDDLPFISKAQAVLPMVSARDSLALNLEPLAVAQSGWRILNLLASVAADSSDLAPAIEETLAGVWSRDNGPSLKKGKGPVLAEFLRVALILCADDDLDASSIAARCIASAGANPYSVVLAGLAAMGGPRSGAAIGRVASLFDELADVRDRKKALVRRFDRGEGLEGFGHPLFPAGDPRAALLLEMLPASRETAAARRIEAAAAAVAGVKPNLEFALVVLERAMRLPGGSALIILAIGRTIGWIAHAIEQYGTGCVIRPRLAST
ncbi:MAG TPA: citrate synthase [Thermoanaerobaculia bacterium]